MIPSQLCRISGKTPAIHGFEEMIATHVGDECAHEWYMHLPALDEQHMPRTEADVLTLLPLRVTCAHCLAWFTLAAQCVRRTNEASRRASLLGRPPRRADGRGVA